MEERDNIVSQLQRLFSPQPDPRVSDPQTVAEASRIAAAGLLSEDVATDAQDQTAHLVPVTGPRGTFEAATRDEATEHAASDTPVVSADVPASGGANPRLATLGLLKAGVNKIVGVEAPLLSDQQGDATADLDLSILTDHLTIIKSVLCAVSSGDDHSREIQEFMSALDDREGGIISVIREVYQLNSTIAELALHPSLEIVNELTRDYEYCKLSRMQNDNAYQEIYEKPDFDDAPPETVAPTPPSPAAPSCRLEAPSASLPCAPSTTRD